MRLLAFVLALLLLAGTVDPTQGWLITLVVLTGIAAFRLRPWYGFIPRPALDVRMASFVLAVLLLAGTIDATKDWLIVLSAVTGVAAFMPGILSLDRRDRDDRRSEWERWCRSANARRWAAEWEGEHWR
jgi:hypothetical protein